MENPKSSYLQVAKMILTYIKDTNDCGVFYLLIGKLKIVGFSKSDWVGSYDDKKTLHLGILFWKSHIYMVLKEIISCCFINL